MIEPKMAAALNKQINEELQSAYLYMAMSADFEFKNRPGAAVWMKLQASEELEHAMKIYGFLQARGGKVVLGSIDAPQGSWDSMKSAFQDALNHEKHITGCINDLVKLAREVGDTATEIFLHWFVEEQVEEESVAETILGKFDLVSDTPNGLYMLDKELGKRAQTK